jgi:hypothetical protein
LCGFVGCGANEADSWNHQKFMNILGDALNLIDRYVDISLPDFS